ncbi:MAG: hypothetical protein JWM63_2640 [Gammaproteobacteria bacterium]|jgi:ElaB/YqjD/DUF883 family membrane-anchored ribosome-binding protein|nr:hypothetical protein [Gammaproteobacteria bacterium]
MNTTAGTVNGDAATADTAQVKDHLRAARDAAASAARQRAAQAQEWGRSQLSDVQSRIESEPYKAAALALGIGLLAGILLTTLARR